MNRVPRPCIEAGALAGAPRHRENDVWVLPMRLSIGSETDKLDTKNVLLDK